jgi:hypothetical protein
VRLKDDGSWQYVGNIPLMPKQQVRTTELDIKLEKVVIETYKKKAQKSSLINSKKGTEGLFFNHFLKLIII